MHTLLVYGLIAFIVEGAILIFVLNLFRMASED